MAGSFVLWGAPLSGKTTYLLSLLFWREHAEKSEEDRRLCLIPATLGAADWMVVRARQVARGEPPAKTGSVERLDFRLYDLPAERPGWLDLPAMLGRRTSSHLADVSVWDAPGEFFSGPIPDELLPEVVRARGLIMVINPFEMAASGRGGRYYWDHVHSSLLSLHEAMARAHRDDPSVAFDPVKRRIRFPVAICLSQIDRADEPGRPPREWLDELLGSDAAILYGWLENVHVFSFTALGTDAGRAAGTDIAVDPKPYGVMYPMSWLVDETRRLGL